MREQRSGMREEREAQSRKLSELTSTDRVVRGSRGDET